MQLASFALLHHSMIHKTERDLVSNQSRPKNIQHTTEMFCVWVLFAALLCNRNESGRKQVPFIVEFIQQICTKCRVLIYLERDFSYNRMLTKGHSSGLVCSPSIMSLPAFWLDCDCLKAKNIVSAECSGSCPRICYHFFSEASFHGLFGNSSTPAILHTESQGELQGTTHDS